MKPKSWIVVRDEKHKDGFYAIESPHNGLQEKLMKQGIDVLATVSDAKADGAIQYVREVTGL